MKIAVVKEAEDTRVAATPEMVKRYVGLGAAVAVEGGAGHGARITDAAYVDAGATVLPTTAEAVADADIVLVVRRPSAEALSAMRRGAFVVGALDPYGDRDGLKRLAEAGVAAVAMELMPRISRAQSMDILSSQANLAGYQAVIDAAAAFDRAIPMMMTAAGTVPAAKVFVMGVGVAGLQAIATARRLGAAVTATDVRPATKEQVLSLGAKFIAVENDEFRQAETAAGYAKEMSADYRRQQGELVAAHVAKQDIVITTALIPGRPAPKLVTGDMVRSMQPGSVLVDLAVERGGNVEGAKLGEAVKVGEVTVLGYANVPGRIAASASALYAKNLYTFVETVLIDKTAKEFSPKWENELITATLLSRDGALVHKQFGGDGAAAGPPSAASAPAAAPPPGTAGSAASASAPAAAPPPGTAAPAAAPAAAVPPGEAGSAAPAPAPAAAPPPGTGSADPAAAPAPAKTPPTDAKTSAGPAAPAKAPPPGAAASEKPTAA